MHTYKLTYIHIHIYIQAYICKHNTSMQAYIHTCAVTHIYVHTYLHIGLDLRTISDSHFVANFGKVIRNCELYTYV